jgi:patatin-related protein
MKRELRLALAMRGGVSLAVWIGGAVSEIDLARRAAREGAEGHDFWPQLLGVSDYERVVVDVLAGASAGGLNGVLYAASQVYDFPYDAMRDVWLTVGGTEGLVRREGPWPSLFKGDDYFLTTVHDKLRALTAARPAPTERERVDLALSATVMEPVVRPLPSPVDEQLVERRYGSGFRFRQPEEPWLPTDFPAPGDPAFAEGLWRLAIAARSTSSYPGAFEAARVRSTRRATFTDPPVDGTGAGVDLDGTFLERSSTADFVVADGGILDNIPIQCALDYVAAAPATGPTERILVYLQPGAPSEPKARQAAGDVERRATLSVARGVLGARIAGETINDDIAAIEAYNEAVERATTLRSATFSGLPDRLSFLRAARDRRSSYNLTRASHEAGAIVALLLDPMTTIGEDQFPASVAGHPVDDARWRSPVAGWPQAVRESLDPALNRALGTTLAGAAPGRLLACTGEVAPLLRVTDLLTAWARWVEPECPEAGAVKGQLYSVRTFLAAILERTRRLAWVAAAARTDADHQAFVDVALPALAGLTVVEPEVAAATVAALRSGEAGPLQAACRQALARIDGVVDTVASRLGGAPAPAPAALAEVQAGGTDLLAEITRLLVALVEPLAQAPLAPSADPAATVAGVPAAPPGELLHRVLAGAPVTVEVLEALDVLCLPEFVSGMPGRRRIDFRRLSSANRTPLAQDFVALLDAAQETGLWWDPDGAREDQQGIHVTLKLAGNELANFSAFLLAHWRANDWLWGRLDAVPTMVELLVRPEQLAATLAAGDDPVGRVRELVAPTGHPWQADLEVRLWAPAEARIAREIEALLAAEPDGRGRVPISAIRTALAARRQWEILGEEYRLPKSPMGNPPGTDTGTMPTFEQVRAWVAGYGVGAETLKGNDHAPELLDRFDEIATAATEMALWNASLPTSRLPRPGKVVGKAIRRLGPRVGRQLARKVVVEKPATKESRTKVAIAFVAAALVVLGVLGWFIDRWAFLLGFAVSFVPLAALGWVAYRRIYRLLDSG